MNPKHILLLRIFNRILCGVAAAEVQQVFTLLAAFIYDMLYGFSSIGDNVRITHNPLFFYVAGNLYLLCIQVSWSHINSSSQMSV